MVKMVKILFSNLNYQKKVESFSLISKVPPLDLMYCHEICKKYMKSELLDANNLELSNKELAKSINDASSDIIVLSFDVYSVNDVKEVISNLKRENRIIVCIGMFPTTNPEFTLKEINSKNIDYSTKINRIKKHLLGRTLRGSIHTKKLPSSISRPLQEDRMYTKECISKMKKLNTKNKLQDNDIMDLCVKLNHISIGNWEIRY